MSTEITPPMAEKLIEPLIEIIGRAAAATVAVSVDSVERRTKDDQSPVTVADEAAEAIILEGLSRLLPGTPVVAEESVAKLAATSLEPSFFSVDPLDGTKEFLAGRDEYTVNIGIVTHGAPIAGLIVAPKQGRLWHGIVGGKAARLRISFAGGTVQASGAEAIHARKAPAALTVETSRSHLDENTEKFLSRLSVGERHPCGSSVKFCYLAQGSSDLYPRLAPTREWDLAAGCAILKAAGGKVTAPDGADLLFGRRAEGFLVPGFIAWGDPAMAGAGR